MQHDDPPPPPPPPTAADAGLSPDDAGPVVADAGAPTPLAECVAGVYPSVASDGSEPEGAAHVVFNYPRLSPAYEFGPFIESYFVERSEALTALLEDGTGLFDVPAWTTGPVFVVGRDGAAGPYRLLTQTEAIARCPGFPTGD